MRTCPKCHEEVADDRRICRRCGSIVSAVEEPASHAAPDALDAEVIATGDGGSSPESEAVSAAARAAELDKAAEPHEVAEGEWNCVKCGSPVPRDFAACWQCGTTKRGVEDPGFPALHTEDDQPVRPDAVAELPEPMGPCPHCGMTPGQEQQETYSRVSSRRFQSTFTSWDDLCREAADFAASVGRQRLISISHSEDGNDGVIIVWHWS